MVTKLFFVHSASGVFLAFARIWTPDAFVALSLLPYQVSDNEEDDNGKRKNCYDRRNIHFAASFLLQCPLYRYYSITPLISAKASPHALTQR